MEGGRRSEGGWREEGRRKGNPSSFRSHPPSSPSVFPHPAALFALSLPLLPSSVTPSCSFMRLHSSFLLPVITVAPPSVPHPRPILQRLPHPSCLLHPSSLDPHPACFIPHPSSFQAHPSSARTPKGSTTGPVGARLAKRPTQLILETEKQLLDFTQLVLETENQLAVDSQFQESTA